MGLGGPELLLAATWVICAVICAIVGSNRKIGGTAGFFLGLFLGIIGLVIVLCSDKVERIIPNFNTSSIPDQLKKYKELLDSGAITEAEYNIQKGRLLNQ